MVACSNFSTLSLHDVCISIWRQQLFQLYYDSSACLAPIVNVIAAPHLLDIDHDLGAVAKTTHMIAYNGLNNTVQNDVRQIGNKDIMEPVGVVILQLPFVEVIS